MAFSLYCSPNGFDSCRRNFLIAGDERQAQAEGSSRNDAVRHIGNDIAGHFVNRLGHLLIHWGHMQAGSWVFKSGLQSLNCLERNAAALDEVNRLDD